jgi:two-component system cell cycle sensor histidine kinase/response regulator CckA
MSNDQRGESPGFDTQIRQAEKRTEQANIRTEEAVAQTAEANKRTEQAEKATYQLAAIIECSEDAVVSITLDGIVIGWNHGAERLYGYMAEEIIGRSVSTLFPPDHYQEYLQIMKKVRNGEMLPPFDTVRRRKDGAPLNVSVGITPIEARDGEVVEASKISHDITRIKKLEAQFIEAQKTEVIGQLASGVAHDFNNILGVIIGYSDLMMPKLTPDTLSYKCADEIRQAAERAVALTRQLLIFSRKETVQPVILDLNEVIKDMDKMLHRLIDENIEMTILPGEEGGRVKADPGQIGQVLMNLVVNARDAMPNGGKLKIETTNVTLDEKCVRINAIPGNYVMLTITDTGSGMSDEVKAHLFEAFFTTKPRGKGTGLGLVTCQTIVKQFGGCIEVQSELGNGTVFKIYFPRVEQPVDISFKPVQAKPLTRGTETLLLVEDEPSVQRLAASVLEAQGYNILRANNGLEGLRVAREYKNGPIRLVITDVIMPLMSGKVMAEWLKTLYPDLKILFTSGYTDDSIVQYGVLKPGIAFLPKPYAPVALTRKVRELLDTPQI